MHIHGPKDAARLGIEVVYQDLALCDNLDVVQNMYLGREAEPLPDPERGGDGAAHRRDAEVARGDDDQARCGSRSRRSPAASASRSRSRAPCMWNSKLVILDEPTAALGVAQTEQVLALVRRLGEQGLGVILISHNLHDVFETADRITVLRLGRNIGVFDRRTTTQQAVVEAITAGVPTKVAGIPRRPRSAAA